MGQEVQVRIANVNTDNNTVNLSMVPAGAFGGGGGGRGGGGYGEQSSLVVASGSRSRWCCFIINRESLTDCRKTVVAVLTSKHL